MAISLPHSRCGRWKEPDIDAKTVRRIIVVTLGAALFSCLFMLSYGYAIHSPRPHDVRIDVVATEATVTKVRAGLDHAVPGGFDLRPRSNVSEARRDITDRSASGAMVVPASGPIDVLTAGAAGVPIQQVVDDALAAVAHAQGRSVHDVDVVPLPTGDRVGQSSFVYEFGLLIPGVIGSVGFYLLGRRVRLWLRVCAAIGYAVLASAFGVLALDTCLGALTGAPWMLMATATLVATAFLLTMAALHALFGLPGTAIGAAVLLVVGNAVNGSTVPIPLLPDGYRALAAWLPNGAAVAAFRDDVYFGGHGTQQPIFALALWTLSALSVIAVTDMVHLRQRRRTLLPRAQIHATPLVKHVGNLPPKRIPRHRER